MDADAEVMDVQAQADRAAEFTRELVTAMGLEGSVKSRVDDDIVLVDVEGDGLGDPGRSARLDAAGGRGARARGRAARAQRPQCSAPGRRGAATASGAGRRSPRSPGSVAEEVRAANTERSLEPMSPPDRKVVHDAVAELDGVMTISEGEEPRRRVVIRPA